MNKSTHKVIRREDYQAPDFLIPEIELRFDIFDEYTRVKSKLKIKNNQSEQTLNPLILDGKSLKLISISMDNVPLEKNNYNVTEDSLTVQNVKDEFQLEIETEIYPSENKTLEGLYQSGDILCTQNESEGFRHITYFIDRPDNMSKYTTTITADKQKFPILLANGNKTDEGDSEDGRHWVTWLDPFKKPCYLFAMVSGDLGIVKDEYITGSGRKIQLEIYVDKGNENRVPHAMVSLKKAMKWDEETFGLECDLDNYKIVAVNEFNFGAMENKGLNIFNAKYVLADPQTATDSDYLAIEGVIAHEYFHNWTGNRVTCRDWFQLTLKEGLTVFRDQEFSSDMNSRTVKRIADVERLRNLQFPEDAGPMSHPIRPDSYIDINNFYTATVYNKGAEVIRMIHTLIGRENFRKGITKYFELFDGQAVTCDDFVRSMEIASGFDLSQFKNWYSQAGTPICSVTGNYKTDEKKYYLNVKQSCRPTPECKDKQPFFFPLNIGLLNTDGTDVSLNLEGDEDSTPTASLSLTISKPEETFVFSEIKSPPVPSLLRDFSAPVKLEYEYSSDELTFLFANDTNLFNRYEAGQRLSIICIRELIGQFQKGETPLHIDRTILDAFGTLLNNDLPDKSFQALALTVPTLNSIIEVLDVYDFDNVFKARELLCKTIAETHEKILLKNYTDNRLESYTISPEDIGKRNLKNTCLMYLGLLGKNYKDLIYKQYQESDNMTDTIESLNFLCDIECEEKRLALDTFYQKWHDDPLVINKWFAVQASSKLDSVYADVNSLTNNPAFNPKNPNNLHSLFGAFIYNTVHFHHVSGRGYRLISDLIIETDAFNPHMAALFANGFKKFVKLDSQRQKLMKTELERIMAGESISPGLYEIISKTLAI